MNSITTYDFPAFLEKVYGYRPFPWQMRLLEQVVEEGGWRDEADGNPFTLAIPTGLGKTAVMDVAVFYMALEASAPTRVVFVVDRRVVVDSTFARAERLVEALEQSSGGGIVAKVADGLLARQRRFFAAEKGLGSGIGAPKPLIASRMRGGTPLDTRWTASPIQPAVICSTVDQVGSRLLFRGYGVGSRVRPIHAGLLGRDSLFVLDEAHMSQAFADTLNGAKRLGAKIKTVSMTATPRHDPDFGVDERDQTHEVAKRRLVASKPVSLYEKKGEAAALGQMTRLAKSAATSAQMVLVVVNTVGGARRVYDRLKLPAGHEKILLTGRARPCTRDQHIQRLASYMTANSQREEANPVVVVATQCVEAGADLDADVLITQLAPLDSLRQRAGRLNRDGRHASAPLHVVAAGKDKVYPENAVESTLRWLRSGDRDFSGRAMETEELPEEASTEPDRAPWLMESHVRQLARTWPGNCHGPDIGTFLHGVERPNPQVMIVWRDDVANDLAKSVSAAPPVSGEAATVPLASVQHWLATTGPDRAAVADVPMPEGNRLRGRETTRFCVYRWAGRSSTDTEYLRSVADLRDGDVIVVRAEVGGCDEHGWNPASETKVVDVYEKASECRNDACVAVRVTEATGGENWLDAKKLLGADKLDQSILTRLPELLRGDVVDRLSRALDRRKDPQVEYLPSGGVVLVFHFRRRWHTADVPLAVTSGDSPLAIHQENVAHVAAKWAQTCCPELEESMHLAARLHDEGKARDIWQDAAQGGAYNRTPGLVLAKPLTTLRFATQWRNWRHEAASVASLGDGDEDILVPYLVGTHHGLGRPLFPSPPGGGEGPQSVGWEFKGLDWPELVSCVHVRYGYWRVAHAESVLRLADWAVSGAEGESS